MGFFKKFNPQLADAHWERQERISRFLRNANYSKIHILLPLVILAAELAALYYGTEYGINYVLARTDLANRARAALACYVTAGVVGVLLTAVTLGWVDLRTPTPAEPGFALARVAGECDEDSGAAPRVSMHLEADDDTSGTIKGWEGVKTLKDLLEKAVMEHGEDLELFGKRTVESATAEKKGSKWAYKALLSEKFEWHTLGQFRNRARRLGAALRSLGLEHGSKVAIYANTSREWQQAAHACFQQGMIVVTAYASLGEGALAFALRQTEASAVICDRSLLPTLARVKRGVTFEGEDIAADDLQHAITIEDPLSLADEVRDELATAERNLSRSHVTVHDFETLLETVEEGAEIADVRVDAEDTAVIMYTSGSTGQPKGVEASHANLVAGVGGISAQLADIGRDDRFLAYLPLAHILEFVAEHTMFYFGSRLGYGAPLTLVDTAPAVAPGGKGDATVFKPTVMVGVPAVYNKLRKAVEAKVSASPIASALFNLAFQWKLALVERHGMEYVKNSVFDPLLFDAIRSKVLGGCVRQCITGGGPIAPETQRWIQIVFCCCMAQGYGLSETMGSATVFHIGDRRCGLVGPPNPSTKIKLVKTSEYDPEANPPRGEIALCGPNIAKGYYKLDKVTREAFKDDDPDGDVWFHTGDVGEWTADGNLKIIDRVKDLVKLAGGEYVSLGKVEREVNTVNLVDNVCIYADSLQEFTVAIVVPNAPVIKQSLGIDAPLDELAENDDVRDAILKAIKKACHKASFKRFEIPGAVVLSPELWTPDNYLTAAQKIRRKLITKAFKKECEACFK